MDYKSNFKEDLRGTTFEELIKEFKSLKNELLYMEECINSSNVVPLKSSLKLLL